MAVPSSILVWKKPMDRGTWWAVVHGVTKGQARLSDSFHFDVCILLSRTFITIWVSLVAQTVKNLPIMQETRVRSPGQEEPLEKELATHSSILA